MAQRPERLFLGVCGETFSVLKKERRKREGKERERGRGGREGKERDSPSINNLSMGQPSRHYYG